MDTSRTRIAIAATAIALSASLPMAFADDKVEQPAAGTAASATATATATDAAPLSAGPLLEERRALLDHIRQAGAHGIGTANYMTAYKSLDEQVSAGASENQIKSRVESLTDALKEQLKRAQILKTQRPVPAAHAETATGAGAPGTALPGLGGTGGIAQALAGAGKGGGKDADALIQRIKERLGAGNLNIPDGVKEKLLNSEKGQEILKRLTAP